MLRSLILFGILLLKGVIDTPPRVQIVIGDGLSSAAILANAMDCMAAIKDGLKVRGIDTGKTIFVIPAYWVGTLYALWDGYTPPTTSVEDLQKTNQPIMIYDIMGRYIGSDWQSIKNHHIVIVKQGNNIYKLIK